MTKRSLSKFKALYEKHFGEKLSDEEAARKAASLVEIYRAVYGNVEFPASDKKEMDEK